MDAQELARQGKRMGIRNMRAVHCLKGFLDLLSQVGRAGRAAEREREVYPPRGEEQFHRARGGGEPSGDAARAELRRGLRRGEQRGAARSRGGSAAQQRQRQRQRLARRSRGRGPGADDGDAAQHPAGAGAQEEECPFWPCHSMSIHVL